MGKPTYPGGKRFAFTVIDDTDVATVENVAPVYRLLHELGMRATKTVWPLGCAEGSRNFSSSETLEDPAYLAFVLDLRRRGFEITWHGATMESSDRARTIAGLEAFHAAFGEYPRVHANHSLNLENVYWGSARVDLPPLKALLGRVDRDRRGRYQGHEPGSAYWWGDLCARHVEYARNLTFNEVNLLRVNPSLPYRDPRRPLVPWWFSASDAEDCTAFVQLLGESAQERLESEGGVCIVATHFGKGFAPGGVLEPAFVQTMERLAARDGWFTTVGELLDWLRASRRSEELPAAEWRRMQLRWAWDLAGRKWRERRRHLARR